MEESITIFCDGGALNNPGPAAAAFVVIKDQKVFYRFSKKIGQTTNNVAEYQAVIAALEWLRDNKKIFHLPPASPTGGFSIFNFYLDSQLVVNQLNGFYKIKDAKLRPLVMTIRGLEQEIRGKIFYHLIPREKNKLADALVKKSLVL